MSVGTQVKNFFRILISGKPTKSVKRVDPLAKAAADLKFVNMGVEDDQLSNATKNQAYLDSFDK